MLRFGKKLMILLVELFGCFFDFISEFLFEPDTFSLLACLDFVRKLRPGEQFAHYLFPAVLCMGLVGGWLAARHPEHPHQFRVMREK